MNQLSIVNDLGDDATLLTKTDMWLETQRVQLSQQLSELLSELRVVSTAQRIKRRLQQTNHVAVKYHTELDELIKIMPLPDAIKLISDDASKQKQLNHWSLDGYDLDAAKNLRDI